MLLSGCPTIDSTFTSVAKLVARDWRNAAGTLTDGLPGSPAARA